MQCLQNAYVYITTKNIHLRFVCFTSSCKEVVRRFQANYPGVRVPSREAVRLRVNKFRGTGSIFDKKRNVKRLVLTEQKLEEIGEKLEKIVDVI